MEMKKINYMLEIDFFKKILTKESGCPGGCFLRVWVSKKTPRRPPGRAERHEAVGAQCIDQGSVMVLILIPNTYTKWEKKYDMV